MYFLPRKGAANAECHVLVRVEHRDSDLARAARKDGQAAYFFDISLQNENEKVFFNV
jgi:protocatechuate 3,4-dioxygenase, alpha subunit